jgi:hypothetical protein
MAALPRIVKVEPLGGLTLRLTFTDGLVRDLDLDPMLVRGIFEQLRNPLLFVKVSVDQIAGTITWPNGVDLDPDVLHGDHEPARGGTPRVLAEERLRSSA